MFIVPLILAHMIFKSTVVLAQGKELVLLENGLPVGHYEKLIASARPGDILVFSSQKKFVVGKILGGKSDLIFECADKDDRIVRVPRSVANVDGLERMRRAPADQFAQLVRSGLQVTQVFVEESFPGVYTVAKKEDIQFRLDEYLEKKNTSRDWTLHERDPVDRALLSFARSTKNLAYIDDFTPEQIVWNGKQWVLLDWGADIFENPSYQVSNTVFDEWLYNHTCLQRGDIVKKLILAVYEARNGKGSPPSSPRLDAQLILRRIEEFNRGRSPIQECQTGL